MPLVRQHLLILNLVTMVVDPVQELTAIRHPQAAVTPTAQTTNHLIATAVPVLEPVLLCQMIAAHERG